MTTTPVLSFAHLVVIGQLVPGDHVLFIGPGPGVVLSCAVVQVLEVPEWAAAN